MTDDEKVLIAKTICSVISDILYGPGGDSPSCNLEAAEKLYGLIDDLGIEDTAIQVVRGYRRSRDDFESDGEEEEE